MSIQVAAIETQTIEYTDKEGAVLFRIDVVEADQMIAKAMKASPDNFLPAFTDLLRSHSDYPDLSLMDAFHIATVVAKVMEDLKKRIESQLQSHGITT